jgi:hypothetical protein
VHSRIVSNVVPQLGDGNDSLAVASSLVQVRGLFDGGTRTGALFLPGNELNGLARSKFESQPRKRA